jgi:glyoxylase-like metal-dependent hydrolase (beta-lactamase superfamily II)
MRAVLEVFTVSPFEENTYLVGDADAGVAVVVDPGGRTEDVLRVAERRGVRVATILATHAHIDHVSGAAALREATGAPFWLHKLDVPLLGALSQQAAMFGLPAVRSPEVDGFLAAGQVIPVGGLELAVLETPGHSPGHVTFVTQRTQWDDGEFAAAFCGDVIFYGAIGRTDLTGGDYDQLLTSIEQRILTLSDDTVLLSGHGPATTVGRERLSNPFVVEWLERSRGWGSGHD